MPITFNVLVTELDKSRFFKGEKGLYANLVLYETHGKAAEFGDYIVKQQGEEGDRMPILGNGKFWPEKGRGRRQDDRGGRFRGGRGSSGGASRRQDDRYDQRRREDDHDLDQRRSSAGDEEIPF